MSRPIAFTTSAQVARAHELEAARMAALRAQVARAESFGRDAWIALIAIVAVSSFIIVYFA